jgi:C-terminal processing protease CtpA/Prc
MLSRQDRLMGLFRLGWAVRTHFVNFDLVPTLDWEREVEAAIPSVEETESVEDYYRCLQRLVAKLRDGHSYVTPPREVAARFGRPPVEVEWVENQPVVTWADPTLEEGGLRRGAIILRVNGQPARDVLNSIFAEVSASTEHGLRARACRRLLVGPAEEPARVVIERTGGSQEILLPRTVPGMPGRVPLPRVEARWFGAAAYIAVNTFADEDAVPEFDRALDGVLDAESLILDLRRNDGGNGLYAREIAARLTDRPLQFERARTRVIVSAFEAHGWPPMHLEIEPDSHPPRHRPFLAPLAILTGPITWSAAEDFIVGLHGAGRAVLVGQPTHGSTGQPLHVLLPGRGSAGICARRCTYPDGREFVGKGIYPDVPAAPTIHGLVAGRDEVLEATLHRGPGR